MDAPPESGIKSAEWKLAKSTKGRKATQYRRNPINLQSNFLQNDWYGYREDQS